MKAYIKRFDERIQRYSIKKSNLSRFYEKVGRYNRSNLYQYKIYESLAALSYSPSIEKEDDCRVWVYDKGPRARSHGEMVKELERMMKSIRLGNIEEHVQARTQIGQFITRDQVKPSNFRLGQFYGYVRINGYEYRGEKSAIKWVMRDARGTIKSSSLRKEGL